MDAAAGVKRIGVVALAVVLIGYALVWTLFATVILAVGEGPRNWIGWLVIVANPLSLGITAGLIQRHRTRKSANG